MFTIGSNVAGRGFTTTIRYVQPIPAGVAGLDRLRLSASFMVLRWLGGAAGGGTVKLGSPILRKIANPRAAWGLA